MSCGRGADAYAVGRVKFSVHEIRSVSAVFIQLPLATGPPPMTIARFVHLTGRRAGAHDLLPEPLPSGGATLGRDAGLCAVVTEPDDAGVSREHARVWRDAEGWWIEDRATRNGTTVNGVAARGPTRLVPGAVIGLGRSVRLRFELEEVAAPGPPRPPRLRLPVAWLVLALVVTSALMLAGLSVGVMAYAARARIERAERRHATLARELEALPRDFQVDAEGRYHPPASLLQALSAARKADAAAPALVVDEDPLARHLRQVLTDLSGDPAPIVRRLFRDEVAAELPLLLKGYVGGYCRSTSARPAIEAILREELTLAGDRPERAQWLSYIPWIESEYYPDPPLGGDGERGMWQFIPRTGAEYKLVLDQRDDRCDWRVATRAAAAYFHDSFAECTDQFPLLAVAAFNTGAHNSCKLARDDSIPAEERDHLGFIAAGLLNPVTHDYVPRWLAATFLGTHTEQALAVARARAGDAITLPACSAARSVVPADGPCGPARVRQVQPP